MTAPVEHHLRKPFTIPSDLPTSDRGALFMRTHSGKHFHPFAPNKADFTFDDICFALARINRFGGHCERYSVAEHSVLVATIVDQHFKRPDLIAEALYHDAPEAFYGDVVSPLQRGLPDFKQAYAYGEAIIFDALGLPAKLHAVTREADMLALALEARDLIGVANPREEWNLPVDPLLAPMWIAERECSEVWAEALFRAYATSHNVVRSW